MINKALREYIESEPSSIEETLRQVLREELSEYKTK